MGEKDITEKMLESYNEVFADIVNVLLFKGKRVIKPEELQEADPHSWYKADGTNHELERDILKRVTEGNIHVASIGFENQTAPDPEMVFRVFAYDAAEYMTQKARNGHIEHPVVTLVLYFNYERPWNCSRTVKQHLSKSNRFDPFYSDYAFNLFQIADLTPEQVQLFQSDFREVADFFVQKKQNGDYKPKARVVKHMKETLRLLSVMTKDNRILDAYQPEDPQGVPRTMCDVIDRIVNRSRKEGREEGREEGIDIGIDKLTLLMKKLFDQNRIEDLKKISEDKKYCKQLLKEFAIV